MDGGLSRPFLSPFLAFPFPHRAVSTDMPVLRDVGKVLHYPGKPGITDGKAKASVHHIGFWEPILVGPSCLGSGNHPERGYESADPIPQRTKQPRAKPGFPLPSISSGDTERWEHMCRRLAKITQGIAG